MLHIFRISVPSVGIKFKLKKLNTVHLLHLSYTILCCSNRCTFIHHKTKHHPIILYSLIYLPWMRQQRYTVGSGHTNTKSDSIILLSCHITFHGGDSRGTLYAVATQLLKVTVSYCYHDNLPSMEGIAEVHCRQWPHR